MTKRIRPEGALRDQYCEQCGGAIGMMFMVQLCNICLHEMLGSMIRSKLEKRSYR
jgi:ribosomal protein S14